MLLKIARGIGEVKGEISGIGHRIKNIEANVILTNDSMHNMAAQLAVHEQAICRHEKKLSDLYRKVDITEDTGMHYIVEQKAKWSTLKVIGTIFLGMISAIGVAMGALKYFHK